MVLKIGHKGATGYEPENTLRSFQKALALGVDLIELDVHQCRSGELVVIHDERVNRTTNGKGLVAKKTLTELRALDAGKGEKIPTLEEVLELVNKKVPVNVELKGKNTAKPVFKIIEKYISNKNWSYENFFISSFHLKELEEFYRLNTRIKLGIIFEYKVINFLKILKKIPLYSLHPHFRWVNRSFIDKVHSAGLKVFVWTVDDIRKIKIMKEKGVDGIISNYPDRI